MIFLDKCVEFGLRLTRGRFIWIIVFLLHAQGQSFAADSSGTVVSTLRDYKARAIALETIYSLDKLQSSITLRMSLTKGERTLDSLSIETGRGEVNVPRVLFSTLLEPQLDTVDVTYTPRGLSHPDWTIWVTIYFGEYVESDEEHDNYSSAEFMFKAEILSEVTIYNAETLTSKTINCLEVPRKIGGDGSNCH
jgi:hypothetical protein